MKGLERFNMFFNMIKRLEGGHSNDVDDSGGETNFGISQKAFPKEDIANLTADRAYQLYKENYFNDLTESLPLRLAFVYFDSCVNCGTKQANIFLQRSLNRCYKTALKEDGIIGNKTETSLQIASGTCFECEMAQEMLFCRIEFYCKLAENKIQKKFLRGWINRIINVNKFLWELRYKI
jgi:lysozyme family protein